ncbi:hypothetical protein GQX74_014711 [Glossina fuscipes]|nr:hypothetical protein GQX74_014711 [Glossina fuscipes]
MSERLGGNGSNDDENDAGGDGSYRYDVLSAYVMCPQISKNEQKPWAPKYDYASGGGYSSNSGSVRFMHRHHHHHHLHHHHQLCINLFGSSIFSTENAKRFADSLSLVVVADEVGDAFAQVVAESGTERVDDDDDVGADVVEIDDGFAWRVAM